MGKHTAVTFIQIVSTYAADIYMHEFMTHVLLYVKYVLYTYAIRMYVLVSLAVLKYHY